MHNYYILGEWNVTCDVCSRKIKSGNARKRWDGFVVCEGCYEERHPQDFVRARIDKISVPFTRPIPPLVFVGDTPVGACTPNGSSSIIDYAVVGCTRVDFISPSFSPNLPCVPLIVTSPITYTVYDVVWCCGTLNVQDSITINNILELYNGSNSIIRGSGTSNTAY